MLLLILEAICFVAFVYCCALWYAHPSDGYNAIAAIITTLLLPLLHWARKGPPEWSKRYIRSVHRHISASRKQITCEAQSRHEEAMQAIENITNLVVALHPPSASDALLQELAQAEAQYPSLTFKQYLAAGQTIIIIEQRPDHPPTTIGKLTFPDTVEGQAGFTKFRAGLDEGRETELGPGEFLWDSDIQVPGPAISGMRRFKIIPHLPIIRIPVRMELPGRMRPLLSEYVIDRLGEKEIAFHVTGLEFSAVLRVTIEFPNRVLSAAWEVPGPDGVEAELLDRSYEFLISMSDGGPTRIASIANGQPLVEFAVIEPPEKLNDLRHFRQSIQIITSINAAFDVHLRHPKMWAPEDRRVAELLASGIRLGKGWEEVGQQPFSVTCTVGYAKDMVKTVQGGETIDIRLQPQAIQYQLLGNTLTVDNGFKVCVGCSFLQDPASMLAYLDLLDPSSAIWIPFTARGIVHVFPRWMKGGRPDEVDTALGLNQTTLSPEKDKA